MVRNHLGGHAETKHIPLTFDHSLALQGSPVYLGSNQVSVSWLPEKQQWDRFHTLISYRFDKDGKCVSWDDKTIFLTTIPPVTKVTKKIVVVIYQKNDTGEIKVDHYISNGFNGMCISNGATEIKRISMDIEVNETNPAK